MPCSLNDIEKSFKGDFLQALANELRSLPNYTEQVEREKKYWTAEQIRNNFKLPFTAPEIEDLLLKLWMEDKSGKIRPAKYPHQKLLVRLWGHTDNLYPLNKIALAQYRYDQVEPVTEFNLPLDAPGIFISFSYTDRFLAMEIRSILAAWGVNAWLYINKIPLNGKITEEVNSAVLECHAAMVLITGTSIGSAWIYSEFSRLLDTGKPFVAVFDAGNTILLDILKTWQSGINYQNKFDKEKAGLLVDEYERNKGSHHVEGFRDTMNTFLSCLSVFKKLALYPDCPAGWDGPPNFIGFKIIREKLFVVTSIAYSQKT